MTDAKDQAQKIAGELGSLLKGGGAADVVNKLGAAGLGDVASSWVGLGKNLPISPSQIESILGNSTVKSIASKLGISTVPNRNTLSKRDDTPRLPRRGTRRSASVDACESSGVFTHRSRDGSD